MSSIQLQRDPFARAGLMREKASEGSCAECGRHGRRWRYAWEGDSLRAAQTYHAPHKPAFCSVGCFRSYWS